MCMWNKFTTPEMVSCITSSTDTTPLHSGRDSMEYTIKTVWRIINIQHFARLNINLRNTFLFIKSMCDLAHKHTTYFVN